MNIKPGYMPKEDQREDPVLWRTQVPAMIATLETRGIAMVAAHFGAGRSKRLSTWGRSEIDPDGPHWIGVRNGTPLHTDPRYPRYTHQLVIHNGGWSLGGLRQVVSGDPFSVGSVFCCDTHSPHVLLPDARLGRGLFYLAASMDARSPLPPKDVIAALVQFVDTWEKETSLQ